MASVDPSSLARAAERERLLASMRSPYHRALSCLDLPVAHLVGVVVVFMVTFLNLSLIHI